MTPTINVIATRSGRLWTYTYVNPCVMCGKRHVHGGGIDAAPDLPLKGKASWMSHCTEQGAPKMVTLKLVEIVEKPLRQERDLAAEQHAAKVKSPLFHACTICPPLPDGRSRFHKRPMDEFHAKTYKLCDVCDLKPDGQKRRHALPKKRQRSFVHIIDGKQKRLPRGYQP